jgi:transposase
VILAVALELSQKCWKIALQDGRHDKPSIYNAYHEEAAGRLAEAVIEAQKVKWHMPIDCRVAVMCEAGQDGFWLCQALKKRGYEALIVDPASIPVERQARRAKTDRLDAIKLVNCLLAYLRGERDRMHVIRIPEEAAEEQRHLPRDRGELQKEIGQHRSRMRKLLRTVGNWGGVEPDYPSAPASGASALPPALQERFSRECERMALVEKQLATLEIALAAQLPVPEQERSATCNSSKGWAG